MHLGSAGDEATTGMGGCMHCERRRKHNYLVPNNSDAAVEQVSWPDSSIH